MSTIKAGNIKTPQTGNFHNIWQQTESYRDECARKGCSHFQTPLLSERSSVLSFASDDHWPEFQGKWFPGSD